MPDATPPPPSPMQATATLTGLATIIPAFLFSLPAPWGMVVAVSMVVCSAIVAAIPPPIDNGTRMSKALGIGYSIVKVGAIAVKYAIPFIVSHRATMAASQNESEAPHEQSTP